MTHYTQEELDAIDWGSYVSFCNPDYIEYGAPWWPSYSYTMFYIRDEDYD